MGPIANLDLPILSRRWQRGMGGNLHLRRLLMKKSREQQEIFMLESEPGSPFRDASFSEDDALLAGAERFADQRPFFKSVGHAVEVRGFFTARKVRDLGNACLRKSRLVGHLIRMAYKIDLHCHSYFSGDGVSSPEEMIASARKKGLNGFALTDHNTSDGCRYLLDKGLVREDGQPVDDFVIIPGVEVTTDEGHLLCLGVILPYLKGKPAAEVCRIVHDMGGITIPPHPYDLFRAGIRESVLETLQIDALEVFNAATTLKRYNRKAFEFAQTHKLPMTAGSDAHHEAAIGTAYTILDAPAFSVASLLDQVKKGTELNQQYLSPKDAFRKTWNNWLRLRKRRVHKA